jgi:chromosome segregation ATPase
MDEKLESEQLQKRVEWLDNERRNDKTLLAALQSKIENYELENAALRTRLAEMDSEITRLNTLMARLEQFDGDINEIRATTNRQMEDFKEALRDTALKSEKHEQVIEGINQSLTEYRKQIQGIKGFEDGLEERKQEDIRLSRITEELKSQISEVGNFNDDYKRSLRLIEESQRQDTKRMTDLQGEVAAIRKRQDETRGKQDLVGDNMRKVENRVKDLLDAESERRESQTAFLEKLNLAQVERDRIFTAWESRFDEMERVTGGIEAELTDLENTHRSVKQSQAALDEVTQRFDRRINEITEIQRLNEDRFRQEWTSFKSDDQKRWSNYTLTQDEQNREMNLSLENLSGRIANLEDRLEDLQDTITQIGKDDIMRMTALLNSFRESIDTYNRIFKD